MKKNASLSISKFEKGQNIVIFAIMLPVIFMLVALMVDIGGAGITLIKAQIAVDSAAFAASQAIDQGHFIATNEIKLDEDAAAQAAGRYASLNSNGSLQIMSINVSKDRVWVFGRMQYRTLFADGIGIPVITIDVISSAVPGYGIEEFGQ